MIRKSTAHRFEMLSEELRKKKIKLLEEMIEALDELADGWRKEKLARGEDITKDISLSYKELITRIIGSWQESEKELLELEGQFRRVFKPESRNAIRNTKRRNKPEAEKNHL